MAQSDRDRLTSDVTSAPKDVDDGFGGVKEDDASVVVPGYTFDQWPMSPFATNAAIIKYRLKQSAETYKGGGPRAAPGSTDR